MSSPPWYMHLPYGISLPLQMSMRNRISPPKDVHNNHIEMTKTLRYTLESILSPFLTGITREKRVRDEGMNNDNDATKGCEMNEKMKFKPKTK